MQPSPIPQVLFRGMGDTGLSHFFLPTEQAGRRKQDRGRGMDCGESESRAMTRGSAFVNDRPSAPFSVPPRAKEPKEPKESKLKAL